MDVVITLLTIVGLFVVLNFAYRWYKGFSKFYYMQSLIKRSEEGATTEAIMSRFINGKPSTLQTIPHDIYKYCMKDSTSRYICEKHQATAEDFEKIYRTLVILCPATIKTFFVPISVFFFYPSLDYVLTNKDNLKSKEVHSDLLRFFEAQ
ncbi:MAG: hypothetical protein IKE46_08390 [Selenomonadaceae bacterium]|nr:hypothetical protein [Selenomonadaceae bacterium]